MSNTKKPQFNILVIGKTGAGKSTAINMLINLGLGLNYEDERVIAITQSVCFKTANNEEQTITLKCSVKEFMNRQSDVLQSQSQSQTKNCFMYSIENEQAFLTFIDTPGIGDTQGPDKDEMHINRIISRVQDIAQINAILYVHRGSDCREDLLLKYQVNKLRGMLTKDCKNNFIVCYTSVVNPKKIDAQSVLKKMGLPSENNIYFENDCLIPPFLINGIDEKKLKQYMRISKSFWESNQEQFQELLLIVDKMKPQQTKNLLDLRVKQESMMRIACEKYHQIKKLEIERANLEQTQNTCKEVESSLNKIKSTSKQPVVKYQKVPHKRLKTETKKILEKITFCFNCLSKCHNPCQLSEVYERRSLKLSNCQAFGHEQTCKVCNHGVDFHGHTNEITEEIEETYFIDTPYTEYEYVSDELKVQAKKQLQEQKIDIQNNIKKMQEQLDIMESTIQKDLKIIAILYEKVQEDSMYSAHDTTIEYLENYIEQIKKDPKITTNQRDKLIKNFTNSKDNYIIIKNQIANALAVNNKEAPIDKELEDLIQQRLKQTEGDVMKSNQESQQQLLLPQQPFQRKKGVLWNLREIFTSTIESISKKIKKS